jgi:hypothetical protein
MNRFLVGICVVFASACGFVQGDASTPFPSDGIGAFQNPASIEVCLGTARIISPVLATGTTALCVPSEQKVRTCGADDECQGLEKCICGRCIVEPCQGGSACVDGNVCRGRRCTTGCAEDSDCLTQERCISGGCAKTCKTHGDCHYGERCDSLDDVCVVSLCGTGSSCGAGSECESVAEIAEMREPAYLGDEPLAFVQLNSGNSQALYRAQIVSSNAWRVDPPEPVFVMAGETIMGGPTMVRRNGSIDLYAAVGVPSRIVQAQSTDDGKSFTLFLDPVLVAAEPWENGSVGSPAVFDFRGETYLLYEGGDRAGIGLARLTGNGAERTQPNPILAAKQVEDPIFWRQITHVGAPFAVVANDDVRILFTARGVEGFSATSGATNLPPDANDSIGLAATQDLQTFALFPTGPLYARIVNLRAYLGEAEVTMRLSSSGGEMVFVSSDASGEGKTGIVRVVGRGFEN